MKRRNITATTVSGVEEDLTKCIASIENGTYSALMNINEGLVRTRERKVACADKRRKLNIKSINELFKYDLRDLQVQYENAYEATKDHLISELRIEANELKLKIERESHSASKKKPKLNKSTSESSLNSDGEVTGTRATRTTKGDTDFMVLPDTVKDQNEERRKERELSSSSSTSGSGNERGGYGKDKLKNVEDKEKALRQMIGKKRVVRGSGDLVMDLSEAEQRQDFAEIVSDLNRRSFMYTHSAPKPERIVKVITEGSALKLKFQNKIFSVGELINVFSAVSQETLSGVITAISDDFVSLRCGSGAKFHYKIEALMDGNISIAEDEEAKLAAKLIQEEWEANKLLQMATAAAN